MAPDDYQEAWRAHWSHKRITIDADSLMNIVRRSERDFRAMISWGEFTFIAILLLLLPGWIYLGVVGDLPWTWYLMVPVLLWPVVAIPLRRLRHKETANNPGEPLLSGVRNLLTLVDGQIQSTRSVIWRWELAVGFAMLAFFTSAAWQSWLTTRNWLQALIFGLIQYIIVFAVEAFIHYINKFVIHTQYEPRRRELLALIAGLSDESTSEVSGEYPILLGGMYCMGTRRQMIIKTSCILAIFAMVLVAIGFKYRYELASVQAKQAHWAAVTQQQETQPKVPASDETSPFDSVRWQQTRPEVKVGDEWFKLVSLDDIPASEIIAFSQRTYGDNWRKRFEEDLIDVLTRMGHPPRDTVKLVVQPLTSSETRTLKDVTMTRAKRQAIWDTARDKERGE